MTNDEPTSDERGSGDIIPLPRKNGPGRWPKEIPGLLDPSSAEEALKRAGYHKRGGQSRRALIILKDLSHSIRPYEQHLRAAFPRMMATVMKDQFAKARLDMGVYHCNSKARLRYLGPAGEMPEIPIEFDYCTHIDVWLEAAMSCGMTYRQFMASLGIPVRKEVHLVLADGNPTRDCKAAVEKFRDYQKELKQLVVVQPVAIGDQVDMEFLATLSISKAPIQIDAADLGDLFSWATGLEG